MYRLKYVLPFVCLLFLLVPTSASAAANPGWAYIETTNTWTDLSHKANSIYWGKVTGAAGYMVEVMKYENGVYVEKGQFWVDNAYSSDSHTLSSYTGGTAGSWGKGTYNYRIKAKVDGVYSSGLTTSNNVYYTTPKPTTIKATGFANAGELTWDNPKDEDGYLYQLDNIVRLQKYVNGVWTTVRSYTATEADVKPVKAQIADDASYRFSVAHYNANLGYSSTYYSSTFTRVKAPSSVSITKLGEYSGGHNVSVQWTSMASATKYKLRKYRCLSDGTGCTEEINSAIPLPLITLSTSWSTSVPTGQNAKYCVASLDSRGAASASTCSALYSIPVPPPPAPAWVTVIKVSDYPATGEKTGENVSVQWAGALLASSYKVRKYRCLSDGTGCTEEIDPAIPLPNTSTGTQWSTIVSVGQHVKYCVSSLGSTGAMSASTCSALYSVAAPPPPPVGPPAPTEVKIQKLGDYPTHDHLAHEVEIIWPTVTQAVNHWVRKYRCNSDGSGCVEEVNSYALLPRKVLGGGGAYTQAAGSEIAAGQSAKFCVNSIDSGGLESAYTCSTIYSVPAAVEPALGWFTVDYTDPNETEDTYTNEYFGVTFKWEYLSPSMVYGLEDFLIRKWICSDDANGHRTCDEIANNPADPDWPLALPFVAAEVINPGIPGQSTYLQWPMSQKKNGQAIYCIVPRTETGGTYFEYGSYRCTTNLFPTTPF